MKSSTRRLIIDRLLAERGVVPFELFEEVLRVSAPTIKRDLRYMREELGAPIQFSKARGGYCYAESPDADEHKTVPALRAKRASQSRTFDPFRRTKDRSLKLRSKQWYSSDELFVLTSTYDLLGQLEADGSSALAKELSPLRARVMDLFNLGGTSPRMLMRHVRVIDRSVIFREPEAFELVGCALCENAGCASATTLSAPEKPRSGRFLRCALCITATAGMWMLTVISQKHSKPS